MSKISASKLFKPTTIGNLHLKHRVVHCPLTRFRADNEHAQTDLVAKYYGQRSSEPGTLLLTEATFISPQAGGFARAPGIYTDKQISQWRKVTDTVHANGSYIFLQLWALGRVADPTVLEKEGPYQLVGASPIPFGDQVTPRELSKQELKEYTNAYATAASNAVHKAGFDGVEIHGANGYLLDQFTQDITNQRTDEYGGSVENRARFPLEVAKAVVEAVGESKVGYRISPWSGFQGMGMKEPLPQFTYLAKELKTRFPSFAYLHVIEPRVDAGTDRADGGVAGATNDPIRDIWSPKPYIAAGGFQPETAFQTADENNDLVAFGRYFIANPDLVQRLKHGWPLNKGDRSKYYTTLDDPEDGYTNYPFYSTGGQHSHLWRQ